MISEGVKDVVSANFDRQYYLSANPDVGAAGVDPLEHYLIAGSIEGRRPVFWFDPGFYRDRYADIVNAGVEPFYHYLVAGKTEGRMAEKPFAIERHTIARAFADEAHYVHSKSHETPIGLAELIGVLDNVLQKACSHLVLSVSHDEYTKISGGLQNAIGQEQREVNARGAVYIHVAPAVPNMGVRESFVHSAEAFRLTVDGRPLALVRAEDLNTYLARWRQNNDIPFILTIHSVLGHSVGFIEELALRLKPNRSFIWLHDFSTLCRQFALLRNDYEFCWAPELGSHACQVCAHGAKRSDHVDIMRRLFRATCPTVLAPSEVALDLWKRANNYIYERAVVVPHATMVFDGTRPRSRNIGNPLRVAHVGVPMLHKGWPVFEELASNLCARDPRYEFFLFSAVKAGSDRIQWVSVDTSKGNCNTMVEALQEAEIDVVIHWSLCYETFSFSACESILSGAYVIVMPTAGNATLLVQDNGAGEVCEDKAALFELFQSGEIVQRVKDYRDRDIPTGDMLMETKAVSIMLNGASKP